MTGKMPDFPFLTQVALSNLEEGILLIDEENRVQLWNGAYLEMLDLPPTFLHRGETVTPLIRALAERGDYGPGILAEIIDRVTGDVRARCSKSNERQRANGRIIMSDWIVAPHDHLLFRLRDVTSERMTSRFKDEVIATVSHELRTPLTVISGALSLLRASRDHGSTDKGNASLVDVAYKNCERLNRLVNDLLDLDRVQSGNFALALEKTDVAQLVTDSARQNDPYLEELGVGLTLDVPGTPVLATIDPGRLHQVLSNLLSNAGKFSPAGSEVRFVLHAFRSTIRISVIDQGRGMSPEFSRRLFTRFAQEGRVSESGKPGSGLGLAICKDIVELHHGHIHVVTQEGIGTIVHIDLPRA
jgi:signal transduction histidine kinase